MASAVPSLADETDSDLLFYMSLADEEPAAAREAWEEFYKRHVEYLHGVCYRYADLLGGAEGVADLVSDTFRRAYEKAGTFDADGLTSREAIRRRTRAWLGTIADRLLKALLRGKEKLPTVFREQDHWQNITDRTPPSTSPSMQRRIELAATALRSDSVLTEREREVTLVTMQWYRADKEHQRLPNDISADLALDGQRSDA